MATKVFVGNLSFSYTEADLGKEFEHIGEVTGAQIIMQGRRSLGYGFVEFATAEEAKKAVEQMNKKELGGREVNVEFAKPPPERSSGEDGEGRRGGRRGRGRGRGRGRAYRRPREGNAEEDGEEAERPPRRRGGRRTEQEEGDRPERGARRGRGRGKRNRVPEEERPDSETLLFVANLPWEYENEDLAKLFEGLNVTEAHVVKTRTGRSRGYGFVEFADQAAQLEALKQVDGKEVDGKNGQRAISVKIAHQGGNDNSKAAEAKDASEETTEEVKETKETEETEEEATETKEEKAPAAEETKEEPKKAEETKTEEQASAE